MSRRVLPLRVGPHRFSLDMHWVDGIRRLEDDGLAPDVTLIDLGRRLGLVDVPDEPAVCVRLRNVPRPIELRCTGVAPAVSLEPAQLFAVATLLPLTTRPAFTHVVHLPAGPGLQLDVSALVPGVPPAEEALVTLPTPVAGMVGAARIVLLQVPSLPASKRPLTLGVSAAQTLEVTSDSERLLLPEAPQFRPGFLTWRERPVPILDLGLRLGLTTTPATSAPRMLIMQTGGAPNYVVAIPVLANVRVRSLPLEHMRCERRLPIPEDLAHGAVELAEETVAVVDLAACLRGG
jgi:chemotaxis signal transduction protein